MAEIFEILIVICFGESWLLSSLKSYKAMSAK